MMSGGLSLLFLSHYLAFIICLHLTNISIVFFLCYHTAVVISIFGYSVITLNRLSSIGVINHFNFRRNKIFIATFICDWLVVFFFLFFFNRVPCVHYTHLLLHWLRHFKNNIYFQALDIMSFRFVLSFSSFLGFIY